MFSFAFTTIREPPKITGFPSWETIHASVPLQETLTKPVADALRSNSTLVQPLEGFEVIFKDAWVFAPETPRRAKPRTLAAVARTVVDEVPSSTPATIGKGRFALKEVRVVTTQVSAVHIR